jgi:hypothetical protein
MRAKQLYHHCRFVVREEIPCGLFQEDEALADVEKLPEPEAARTFACGRSREYSVRFEFARMLGECEF